MYTFLNGIMQHWVKTPSTKSHILCNKNLGGRHGELLKMTCTAATTLGYLPQCEGKALFLKPSHTSDTGLGGIELELPWKPLA